MLNSDTLLILAALLFLLLPSLVWAATFEIKNPAVAWWCAGSAMVSLGIALMGLRPWLPVWVSHHGGNTSLMVSLLLWAQSLRLTLGRPWSGRQLLLGVALAAAFYSVLFSGFAPAVRAGGMRWALGGLTIYLAVLSLELARQQRSHNATAMAVAYLALSAMLWGQALMGIGAGQVPGVFSRTWSASALAVVVLLMAMVSHFCYTGLMLDMSLSEQLKARQVQLAADESARLDAQLRQLDRRGRLLLVSGSLAHELNQPLTAALMHTQVAQRGLQSNKMGPEALSPLLAKVEASIRRASAVLTRIRQSSRADGVRLRPLDLREVAQGALDLFTPEWRRQNVLVDCTWGERPLPVRGDEVALSQVLINLLRNATQAMEHQAHKALSLHCECTDSEVRVSVRDHGPGVPQAVLAQWGEPFMGTKAQGLGLGLAISRAIAHQHQGQLLLANHPEGGAQAVLTLPRDGGA